MEPFGYVYLVTNQVNGKVYVGQTVTPIEARWGRHKTTARSGKNRRLYNSIRKHGHENFKIAPLHTAQSKEELDALEIKEIASRRSEDRDIGYNMTPGGDNGVSDVDARRRISEAKKGVPNSAEHRRKVSEANKGRPMHPAARAALLAANTGRVVSEETRQKMRIARLGKELSEETRNRMSASKTGLRPNLSEEARTARRELMKGNTYGVGRTASEETRAKLSEANAGEKNHFFGKTHTEAARQKISDAHKGKPLTDEHKANVSASLKGRALSDDHRAKLAAVNTGKRVSEETKQKLRDFNLGKSPSEETRRKLSESVAKSWDKRRAAVAERAVK